MAAWYGCASKRRAYQVIGRRGGLLVLRGECGATFKTDPAKLEANGYCLLASKPRYAPRKDKR